MANDTEKNQHQGGQTGEGQKTGQTGHSGQTGQQQKGTVDPNKKNPSQDDEQDDRQRRAS